MDRNSKNRSLLICLALTIVTAAVYYQVYSFEFLDYDDPEYVHENTNIKDGITLDTVKWAFNIGYASNWHPLTWLSHALDRQFFGNDPAGQNCSGQFQAQISG